MRNFAEMEARVAKPLLSKSSWIQITFTLDPDHYRVFRNRAEKEGLTVPGLIREIVMESSRGIGRPRPESAVFPKVTVQATP